MASANLQVDPEAATDRLVGESLASCDSSEKSTADADHDYPMPKSQALEADAATATKPLAISRGVERWCLVILTLLAVFYTLYFTRAIMLPATLAVLINLVLKPITQRLNRWGLPHIVSAGLIFATLAFVVVAGTQLLSAPASRWLTEAPKSFRQLSADLSSYSKPLEQVQAVRKQVDEMTKMPGEKDAVKVQVEQPAIASQVVNTTGGMIAGTGITLVLLFFLLAAGDQFLEKTVQVVPTWRGKRDVVELFRNIQRKISAYLGWITIINIGLGVVIGTGMWAIGMPNPVLWGVMATMLNYIPFAGLVLGTGIVFLAAMTSFDTLGHALLAPAIYLVANGIEANFVTPMLVGKSISLNPVAILVATFLGGWVWGIGGIFLAVPILVVLKITGDNYKTLEPMAIFLSR